MTALLLSLPLLAVSAQEFDPEHRSAIEITAGLSPVQTLLEKYDEDLLGAGMSYRNLIGPGITASYVFDLNDKWTVTGGVNVSRAIFEITSTESDGPFSETLRENGTPTLTFLLEGRYVWLRRPHVKMYSGVGVGMTGKVMLAVFFPTPIPNITPLGITLGTDHIYLTAEITAGARSTGGVAGLGFRF